MSLALAKLFELFSPSDYEAFDEEEIGYAGGLCLPEVCMALKDAVQTVYQYSVIGGYIFLVAAFTAFFNLCGCSLVYWLELGWRFMRCCSCLSCSKKSENISKKTYVILSFHKITNKAACGQSYFLRGW